MRLCIDCNKSVGARPRAKLCLDCARERKRDWKQRARARRFAPAPSDRAPADRERFHMERVERAERVLRDHFQGRKVPLSEMSEEHDGGWGPEADDLYYVSRVRWDVAEPILARAGITDMWHWQGGE